MHTWNTADLASTEELALAITTERFVAGYIDHEELERRIATITGLNGTAERERVLKVDEVVDVTGFGSLAPLCLATAWSWPA